MACEHFGSEGVGSGDKSEVTAARLAIAASTAAILTWRRGNLTAYWWLPLDSIRFNGIGEISETNEEKLYVSAAASLSPHPSVFNYFTVDLAGLKELSQELAGLFGLTLPVPKN